MADTADRVRRAIFGFCRENGIDTETRHAIQLRAVGKTSLTTMNAREMHLVLQALQQTVRPSARRRASKPVSTQPKRREVLPRGPHRSKLRALWICGYELGIIRNRTDEALATWICANSDVDAAVWATPAMTAQCIEGLKDWLAREGGVDWSPYRIFHPAKHIPRARILEAQWRRLEPENADKRANLVTLQAWVTGHRGDRESYTTLGGKVLDELIRELGKLLRQETDDDRA